MKITTFEEMKIKKMRDLLAHYASLVDSGEATGLVVVAKLGERHHGIGVVGEYLDDPSLVHAVTARINYRINELIDERLRKVKKGGEVVDLDKKK